MPKPGIEVLFKKPLDALRLATKTQEEVGKAISRGAFRVQRGAQRNIAVNYGILRGAILALREGAGLVWSVGTRGLRYAQFIEFGTGPAGAASPKVSAFAREAMAALGYKHGPGNFFPPLQAIELWAKRKNIDPELVFPIARAIGRRGIRAQPFLFPAFEKERPRIIEEVGRAVRKVLGIIKA